MKLKVFYAQDGDCLLLTSRDGRHVLIDGGRSTSFQAEAWPFLQKLARSRRPEIDLLVVSHVDEDHITGVLWLLELVVKWESHEFQASSGDAGGLRAPKEPKPPGIKGIWHNSWPQQMGSLEGPIQRLAEEVRLAMSTTVVDPDDPGPVAALGNLALSAEQGADLLTLIDERTSIPRNAEFEDMVLLRRTPFVRKVGTTKLTVLGPMKKHLETLREEWRLWLEEVGDARRSVGPVTAVPSATTDDVLGLAAVAELGDAQVVAAVASAAKAPRIIEVGRSEEVTPPNRASITLLAEEKKRTCLLTGDAAEEEFLDGLKAARRFQDGVVRCNVLKVQHHGSEYNFSKVFAEAVVADDYVFCANGAHGNPDASVVRTLMETRVGDPAPFTVWFNCSPKRTKNAKRSKALKAAIGEATKAADEHGHAHVRILEDDKPYLEISV